jgi:hypothetical protein
MGGYQRSLLKLTFTDPEFAGLEIRAKRISFGKLLGLLELKGLEKFSDASPEVRTALTGLFRDLSNTIVSWNLEDPNLDDPDGPGIPVPVSPEALENLDPPLVMAVVDAIREASVGVAAPLESSSSGGGQSLEASIPMAELSENPTS